MKALLLSVAVAFSATAATTAWPRTRSSGSRLSAPSAACCHQGGPGDGEGGQGPNLNGVVGRKAGSFPGFPYTPALKSSGHVWTQANLDRFLTDPSKAVPGTAMPVSVPDTKTRQDLIAYLATLHGH